MTLSSPGLGQPTEKGALEEIRTPPQCVRSVLSHEFAPYLWWDIKVSSPRRAAAGL